jgi:hypothetical protein
MGTVVWDKRLFHVLGTHLQKVPRALVPAALPICKRRQCHAPALTIHHAAPFKLSPHETAIMTLCGSRRQAVSALVCVGAVAMGRVSD